MAGRGSRNAQQARTQAERARLHTARTIWHQGQIRRRTRDNVIAAIVGALIVIAAIGSQVVHAQVNAPEPTPSPSVSPSVAPTPASETPVPLPSDTPAE
ncbi:MULTISPECIES: hypothetical protein [unclassified Microbacterium]|uniref:hypothetical protein n=1 Tax=unclassified Microbacterium TaxID=2609290 RepID=UPI000EA9C68F|nr:MULTISPECIES: hypothetical protein [unclassified Microbacterium]MBT2485995.1 hypothetical protein [Microbacterium sp. ISL-108]RKN68739.1 hypothetical protein D7252_14895 [Microbacterium sp. CGR2]